MHKIIGVCDACFKDSVNVNQIEEVLNGIVSMLALVNSVKSSFVAFSDSCLTNEKEKITFVEPPLKIVDLFLA